MLIYSIGRGGIQVRSHIYCVNSAAGVMGFNLRQHWSDIRKRGKGGAEAGRQRMVVGIKCQRVEEENAVL